MYPEGRLSRIAYLANRQTYCYRFGLLVYPEERSRCTRNDENDCEDSSASVLGGTTRVYPEGRLVILKSWTQHVPGRTNGRTRRNN